MTTLPLPPLTGDYEGFTAAPMAAPVASGGLGTQPTAWFVPVAYRVGNIPACDMPDTFPSRDPGMSGSASPKLDVTPDWQDHVVDISNGFLIFDDGRCVDPLWGVTIQLSGVPVWVVIAETSDSGLNPQHLFEITDEYGSNVRCHGIFAVFADGSVFTNVTAISNDPYTTLSTLGINDVDALGLFRDDGMINGVIYVAGAQLRVHTFTDVLPATTTFTVPTGAINPVYDSSTIAVIVNGSVQAFNAYDGTSLRVPSILTSGTTSHLHNGNTKQLCAISGSTLYAWNPWSAFGATYDESVTMEGTFEAASEFCRAAYPTEDERINPAPYNYQTKVAYLTSNKLYVVDFIGRSITGSSENDPIVDTYDRSSMPSGVEKVGQVWASYTNETGWHLRYQAISASGFGYVGLLNPSAIQFSEGVYKRIDITSTDATAWMESNDSSDYDPTQILTSAGRDVYNVPYGAASPASDCDESQWVKIDVDQHAFKYDTLGRTIVVGGISREKARYLLVVTQFIQPH